MQSPRINCGQASRLSESINSHKPGMAYLPACSLLERTSTSKHLFLRFIRGLRTPGLSLRMRHLTKLIVSPSSEASAWALFRSQILLSQRQKVSKKCPSSIPYSDGFECISHWFWGVHPAWFEHATFWSVVKWFRLLP